MHEILESSESRLGLPTAMGDRSSRVKGEHPGRWCVHDEFGVLKLPLGLT